MGVINQTQSIELGQKIMRQEVETITALAESLDEAFWQCAQSLIGCRGLVWVTAVGTSAAVAARFAHILTCCGGRAMFLSPSDGLHGHTGIFTPEDILIGMSRGGESGEVNQMIAIGRSLGVKTVAIVHNTESTLARACELVLPVRSPQDYELKGLLATTSTVAYSAMCDALCAVVAEAKGFTAEAFGRIHPGGAVGQALTHKP